MKQFLIYIQDSYLGSVKIAVQNKERGWEFQSAGCVCIGDSKLKIVTWLKHVDLMQPHGNLCLCSYVLTHGILKAMIFCLAPCNLAARD